MLTCHPAAAATFAAAPPKYAAREFDIGRQRLCWCQGRHLSPAPLPAASAGHLAAHPHRLAGALAEYATWNSTRRNNTQLTVQPSYGPPIYFNATNQRSFFVGNSVQKHHAISWKKGQVGQPCRACQSYRRRCRRRSACDAVPSG